MLLPSVFRVTSEDRNCTLLFIHCIKNQELNLTPSH